MSFPRKVWPSPLSSIIILAKSCVFPQDNSHVLNNPQENWQSPVFSKIKLVDSSGHFQSQSDEILTLYQKNLISPSRTQFISDGWIPETGGFLISIFSTRTPFSGFFLSFIKRHVRGRRADTRRESRVAREARVTRACRFSCRSCRPPTPPPPAHLYSSFALSLSLASFAAAASCAARPASNS